MEDGGRDPQDPRPRYCGHGDLRADPGLYRPWRGDQCRVRAPARRERSERRLAACTWGHGRRPPRRRRLCDPDRSGRRGPRLCQPHSPRPDRPARAQPLGRRRQSAQGCRTQRGANCRDPGPRSFWRQPPRPAVERRAATPQCPLALHPHLAMVDQPIDKACPRQGTAGADRWAAPRRADPADAPKRVCLGVVTGPHGVQGAVRIKSFTQAPEDIARYGPLTDEAGDRCFELSLVGAVKGVVLARLSGIEDRDQAEALRGLRLHLPRAALPQTEAEEYYHADLIGLEAVLGDGTRVGRVRAIHDFGAGDTLELARPGASPVMVPFTRAVVPSIELAAGRLVLDPPPGLLDESEG